MFSAEVLTYNDIFLRPVWRLFMSTNLNCFGFDYYSCSTWGGGGVGEGVVVLKPGTSDPAGSTLRFTDV